MIKRLTNSWTVHHVKRWAPYMRPSSLVRSWDAQLNYGRGGVRRPGVIPLRMRRPIKGTVYVRRYGDDLETLAEVCISQIYENACSRLGRCETVIDLGANAGFAARYFAARFPGCRLVCVEPDTDNFNLLELNLAQLAREGRCRLLRNGVWGHHATLFVSAPLHGDLFHAIRTSEGGEGLQTVEAVTVPELIEFSGFGRVDLMKVDVEGAEVVLFEGDTDWLDRVGLLAIEFHENSRQISGFDDQMRRYGFQIDDSHAHTVLAWKIPA